MKRKQLSIIKLTAVWLLTVGINAYTYAEEEILKSIYFNAQFGSVADSAIKDNYAYIVGTEGMVVLDISKPAKPKTIKTVVSDESFNDIFIDGNYAYVTVGRRRLPDGKLKIFDITDPGRPRELPNNLNLPESPMGIVVQNNIAYIGDFNSGLILVDVKDPLQPKIISNFSIAGKMPQEEYQKILNLAKINPQAFKRMVVTKFSWKRITPEKVDAWIQEVGIEYIAKSLARRKASAGLGNVWWPQIRYPYAFVPYDAEGLYILDISNPYKPTQVSSFNKKGPGGENNFFNGVGLCGDIAFIALDYTGILILDLSDLKNPKEIAQINPWPGYKWLEAPGHAVLIEIRDNLMYVTVNEDGLYIYDITIPRKPRLVQKIDKAVERGKGTAWGLCVKEPFVIIGYKKECDTGICRKHKSLSGGLEIFKK